MTRVRFPFTRSTLKINDLHEFLVGPSVRRDASGVTPGVKVTKPPTQLSNCVHLSKNTCRKVAGSVLSVSPSGLKQSAHGKGLNAYHGTFCISFPSRRGTARSRQSSVLRRLQCGQCGNGSPHGSPPSTSCRPSSAAARPCSIRAAARRGYSARRCVDHASCRLRVDRCRRARHKRWGTSSPMMRFRSGRFGASPRLAYLLNNKYDQVNNC
jgi:hypothetical protein